MAKATTILSAVTGTSLLLAGVGAVAPAIAPDQALAVQEQVVAGASQDNAAVKTVSGTFSYDQNVATSNATISTLFTKAAATLCASLPEYGTTQVGICVSVTSPNGLYSGTVADMAAEDGAASTLMGCACATNTAGGGAIMNAQAQGVALATIAALV